jgi:hypothetical protein
LEKKVSPEKLPEYVAQVKAEISGVYTQETKKEETTKLEKKTVKKKVKRE